MSSGSRSSARTYVSYARILMARGESEKAKEYVTKATGMFRGMGMTWDLERAGHALRGS